MLRKFGESKGGKQKDVICSQVKDKWDEQHREAETDFIYEMLKLLECWIERQLETMKIQTIVSKHDKTHLPMHAVTVYIWMCL